MALIFLHNNGRTAQIALLLFAAALASIWYTHQLAAFPDELTVFSPLYGLLVGTLLVIEKRLFWWSALFFFALQFSVSSIWLTPYETIPNAGITVFSGYLFISVACWLMRQRYPDGLQIYRLNPDLREFLLFALAAGAANGLLAAWLYALGTNSAVLGANWHRLMITDTMSILVISTVVLSWVSPAPIRRKLSSLDAIQELSLLAAGLLIVLTFKLFGPPSPTHSQFDFVWLLALWAIFRFDLRVLSVLIMLTTLYVCFDLVDRLDPGSDLWGSESDAITALGAYISVAATVSLILNSLITRKRLQKRQISQSLEYVDRLIQSSGTFFWIYDVARQQYEFFSDTATGHWTDELDMRNEPDSLLDLLHPNDKAEIVKIWNGVKQGTLTEPFNLVYRLFKEGHEVRWDRNVGIPVAFVDGKVTRYIGMILDITDEQNLRAEKSALNDAIFESDKLNSVGALAAGLAHDWNDLLLALGDEIQKIRQRLSDEAWLAPTVGILEQVLDEGRETTSELLGLSQRDQEPTVTCDLGKEVPRAAELLRRALPPDINLAVANDAPGELPVRCRISHLHQIVLNLGLNARDAIGNEKGLINVKLSKITLLDKANDVQDFACFSVSDTGHGIDADATQKIFEPLYTTKAEAGGTGLGLSVVQRFVEEMRGGIEIASTSQQGTVLTIRVPLADEDT